MSSQCHSDATLHSSHQLLLRYLRLLLFLNISSHRSHAITSFITLNCKVGRVAPPLSPSPSFASRKLHRSPSYYRRQYRRKAERDALTGFYACHSTPVDTVLTAEQAEDEIADNSCVSKFKAEDTASSAMETCAKESSIPENEVNLTINDVMVNTAVGAGNVKNGADFNEKVERKIEDVDQGNVIVTERSRTICQDYSRGENVATYDGNLTALENLRKLTESLDAIHRGRNPNTL